MRSLSRIAGGCRGERALWAAWARGYTSRRRNRPRLVTSVYLSRVRSRGADDRAAFGSARSRCAGTASCTSSASSAVGSARARRAKRPWSRDQAASTSTTSCSTCAARRDRRRARRLHAHLRPERAGRDPLSIFKVWEGGMSFHGGFVGVLVAMWLYAPRIGQPFFVVTDFVAPWTADRPRSPGASATSSTASSGASRRAPMRRGPSSSTAQARHASQLYEAFLEGRRAVRRAVAL